MSKICTTIKQSQKLVELGIDVNSADIAWYSSYAKDGYSIRMLNDAYPLEMIGEEHDEIPCWSLSALLELMPEKTGIAKDYTDFYFCYNNSESHSTNHYPKPLDAAFEMVVWLKENNKI